MRVYTRRTAVLTVPGVFVTLLSGCTTEAKPDAQVAPTASVSVAGIDEAKPAKEAPDDGVPAVKPGGSTVFKSGSTAMTVSVGDVTYISQPSDAGFMTLGENAQFVRLHLTVKNTGKASGKFSPAGVQWESKVVAERDASTLGADDAATLEATYKPGQSASGDVVLDVGAKDGTATFFDAQDTEAPTFKVELPK